MADVFVAGVGMTKFGKFLERSTRSLAEEATAQALADAQLPPSAIQHAFFGNSMSGIYTGQEAIRGQVALRHTGLAGIPIVNVENACATGASAFYLAWMAVASGAAEIALAVGAEKLNDPDRSKWFRALLGGVDLEEWEGPTTGIDRSIIMDEYGEVARAYMARSGATVEDFAAVAVKNKQHGALNEKAHFGEQVTIEAVMRSRVISDPLTLLMCCPLSDGAAAVVLCSEDLARSLNAAVRIRAIAMASGRDRGPDDPSSVQRAAQRAYELAGIGPDDIDLAEIHDAAAPAELVLYEELGFCETGTGHKLLASGATRLGGQMPVNTSGGLLARGHPVGATGCAQVMELTNQLRGRCGPRQVEGARTALAENAGGMLGIDPAAAVVTVLSI